MKRTNIMLTDEQHKKLKSYAKKEKATLGELVRESIEAAYGKKDAVEHRKMIALNAYKEGLISIGKLSEILGLDLISTRRYLKEHGIAIGIQALADIKQDAVNA
ncbi:MAG: UPF0175 family protein [Nitrospirae bacterium]|nr:UPF0175 family protein [Nitrospirota bacterium]